MVEIPPIQKKDDVIEVPTAVPETTAAPEVTPAVAPECPETNCCDNDRAQILLPQANAECQKFAKLVIPIDMKIFNQIPISDIVEVSMETNPAVMLLKLLRLVEKCKLM